MQSKPLIILLLAGLAACSPRSSCDAVGTCPIYNQNSDTVLLPHRTRCDVYCRCDHGQPIEMPCGPGMWFNAALQVCDWPLVSGCIPRFSCDAVGTCPIYNQNSDTVLLPHQTRCDVYCRCHHGQPIEMPCGPGMWFNAALQTCDWPIVSGCIPIG